MTVITIPKKRRTGKPLPAPPLLISQSIIKDVREYQKKNLCGYVLHSKYVSKTYPRNGNDSPAKALGRYFEYILSGSLGIDGVVPEAEYKKTALKGIKSARTPELAELKKKALKVSDMTKPYQLAHKNAERVKAYFVKMKIEIVKVNVRIENEEEGLVGNIDIIARYKGRLIVIDVKYSGLIDDKYNELGWQWTPAQKRFHGIQAIQYHKLTGYEFYFLVVSNTNEIDILFDAIFIGTWEKEQHNEDVLRARKELKFITEFGAVPYPEFNRCAKCAIAEGCALRVDVPAERIIDLAIEN